MPTTQPIKLRSLVCRPALLVVAASPAPCHGDSNGDEMVNTADLLSVLSAWGTSGYHLADVTFDGGVDVADVLRIVGNWGPCSSR